MENSENSYIPGTCNINRDEIKKRYVAGFIGAVAFAVLLVLIVFFQDNYFLRLFLFVPAFFSALGFIQARSRFCVAYAGAGKENATNGKAKPNSITDKEAIKIDKAFARSLIFRSAAIAVICLLPALLIP